MKMNTFYVLLVLVLFAVWLIGVLMLEMGGSIHLLFFIALGIIIFLLIKSEKK